jgi:2-phosphoglycerate kinase
VADDLRERLRHVRWLGGGSGAGKSSVALELAARHGVRPFSTDDAMAEHARRLDAVSAPLLHAFGSMTMDERWVSRTPAEMLATFHWFAGEGFHLIVDDLLAFPADRIVVVEGFRLLPTMVRPLLARPEQAVWLLPTPEFRKRAFAARGSTMSIAGRTGDPARALANLLRRDAAFTERLAAETGSAGWEIDGREPLEHLIGRVARRFGLGPPGSTT